MRPFATAIVAAGLALAAAAEAAIADVPPDVRHWMRKLQNVHGQILEGNPSSAEIQSDLLEQAAKAFEQLPPTAWKSPANAVALTAFTLSGGHPRVLSRVIESAAQSGLPHDLLDGALAFAEGRQEEAGKLLAGTELRALPASLVAPVALAQSATLPEERGSERREALDEARLGAPGTLAEEAALRRRVLLLIERGQIEPAFGALGQYLWRFRRSIYAGDLLPVVVRTIEKLDISARSAMELASGIERLDTAERQEIWLAIAKSAVARGALSVAQLATPHVLGRPDATPQQRARAALYAAAVDSANGRSVDLMDGFVKEHLEPEDAELFERVRRVSQQLAHGRTAETAGPDAPGNLATTAGDGGIQKRLDAAYKAMDQVLAKDKRK